MTSNFKVIIAGGGPAGLVAAHSLYLAGIDFIVLEQRNEVAFDAGASLILMPQSLRILHQFGLLERINEIGAEMHHKTGFTFDGRLLGENDSFHYLKDNHGSAPVAFHRSHLIQTIYDGLPDEAKTHILLNKKIANVESSEAGIKVICTDGSVHEGHVLIGADGVHSRTRRQMRKLALETDAGIDWDPEDPYASEYRVLWASFPATVEPGQMTETHNKDHSSMYFGGKTRGWIFLYEKLPHKTQARASYTDQDCMEYAEKFMKYPISKELTVADVWSKRLTFGMSNLEEGVVRNWSWSRIALVGDAAHKYTPNQGLGLNNGIQDVVALCNGIRAAVYSAPDRMPSLAVLTDVFHTYQDQRHDLAVADYTQSARATRTQADANLGYLILGRYITWFWWFQHLLFAWIAPRSIRNGLVLDYVESKEPMNGAVKWTHRMKTSEPEPAKKQ